MKGTSKWNILIPLLLTVHVTGGMTIPEHMEILDGYDFSAPITELDGEDEGYAEQRSLLEPFLFSAIRNRRANRAKRELAEEATTTPAGTDVTHEHEALPEAAMHVMRAAYDHDNKPVVERSWPNTPHKPEFQAKVIREEDDSNAAASVQMNEGIKSRAPRVNFITQQTKKSDQSEGGSQDREKVIRELYRKPVTGVYYERPRPKSFDSFMAPSQQPLYPSRMYSRYDPFPMIDRMYPPAPHRYDHYYERRYDVDYDSYFPRYKFPFYYYYPDNRYDVPLYHRDRNYLYTNELLHGIPSTPGSPPMRNRRIIYYATLPEIVRTPPNVELRYRNRDRFDRPHVVSSTPASFGSYKASDRFGSPGDSRKEDKYVSSKPIKIVREADLLAGGVGIQSSSSQNRNVLPPGQEKRWSVRNI